MFKKIISLFFIITLFATSSGFVVVGHRGDPIKATEETFQSFDTAFNEGAQYVELDVHLSKDNVLVVSHDKDLTRITGKSKIVSQNNFIDLSKLTVSNGENIHSLDQVFAHYQNQPNTKFLIETKKTKKGNPKNMEEVLANVIHKYHMENRVAFHSFSAKSIENLKHYFPKAPRIYISGSLKRINFDVLRYSTGVNISSDLITSKFVNQLHDLHQKVYVWDQMNENPDKWNWLINLSIDGVVTNYPETAEKYNQIKASSNSQNINKKMIYLSDSDTPIFENPYVKNKIVDQATNLNDYDVKHAVNVNGEQYYQLGKDKFANSKFFSDEKDAPKLLPFTDSLIRSRIVPAPVYGSPNIDDLSNKTIINDTYYPIHSIKKDGSNVWYQIDKGWVLATDVLSHINNENKLQEYLHSPAEDRLTNLDLTTKTLRTAKTGSYLPSLDFTPVFEVVNQYAQI